jgi:esterase/lipase superfamily enzyme
VRASSRLAAVCCLALGLFGCQAERDARPDAAAPADSSAPLAASAAPDGDAAGDSIGGPAHSARASGIAADALPPEGAYDGPPQPSAIRSAPSVRAAAPIEFQPAPAAVAPAAAAPAADFAAGDAPAARFEPMAISPRLGPASPESSSGLEALAAPADLDTPWIVTPTDPTLLPRSSEPIGSPGPGYQIVNVLYGTNRRAAPVEADLRSIDPGLFATPAVLSLLGALLGFGLHASGRRRTAAVFGTCMVFVSGWAFALALNTGLDALRARDVDPAAATVYGHEPGDLVFGQCDVSIPPNHRPGELEAPTILKLEFEERPDRHVVLLDVQEKSYAAFKQSLAERVVAAPDRDLFVFIHGYNVSFEDAARRTAQMAFDLKFRGAPLFFSWPSAGGLLDYPRDEAVVEASVPALVEFLQVVRRDSQARSIHLVAHSMGNRALAGALEQLRRDVNLSGMRFNQVVLAAPDIDGRRFREEIAPRITSTAERVTLYASDGDKALLASRLLNRAPRAGQAGRNLIITPGVDTVDASAVDTSFLGHSYYGGSPAVLDDLQRLFHADAPYVRPGLVRRQRPHGAYWELAPHPPRTATRPPLTIAR